MINIFIEKCRLNVITYQANHLLIFWLFQVLGKSGTKKKKKQNVLDSPSKQPNDNIANNDGQVDQENNIQLNNIGQENEEDNITRTKDGQLNYQKNNQS